MEYERESRASNLKESICTQTKNTDGILAQPDWKQDSKQSFVEWPETVQT